MRCSLFPPILAVICCVFASKNHLIFLNPVYQSTTSHHSLQMVLAKQTTRLRRWDENVGVHPQSARVS